MSRAAGAKRSVTVWLAGLAMAWTAAGAAPPALPGLPPIHREIRPRFPLRRCPR